MARLKGSRNLNSLERALIKAKMTQAELSRLSGIPEETISRYIHGKGKRGASLTNIGKLAEALGIEPDALADLRTQKEVSERTKRRMKQKEREAHEAVQDEEGQPSEPDIPANELQLVAA